MNIYVREERIDKGREQLVRATLNFPDMIVEDYMRPLDKVYMLDIESRFDMELMRDIYENGYSRIPIYEKRKNNIIGIMMAKDLMFLDREKIQKLWQLKDLFMRKVVYINADDKLAGILAEFKKGKPHLAVVRKVIYSDTKDHDYEMVGVLTMEDIIEALIHDQILDEHDIERDRKDKYVKKAALLFAKEEARFALTKAEIDAIHIFFTEKVPQFSKELISSAHLTDLIEQSKVISLTGNEDSILNITLEDEVLTLETIRKESVSYDPAEDREWDQPEKLSKYLYKKGQVSSNCYFIINGRVELNVGRDELRGDYGAFNILGNAVLKEHVYVPDYTAKVIGASRILKIKRRDYFRLCESVYTNK